jgi:hypothetical protein
MTSVISSNHTMLRAQQRGIRDTQIDAVGRYADMEARRGDGCASMWISKRELQRLGPRTPEGVPTDQLQGLIVLEGEDRTCVTVFRNRDARRYRRDVARRRYFRNRTARQYRRNVGGRR